MKNVDKFKSDYANTINYVAKELRVDPAAIAGQFGLETGWGKSVIPGTNNLGNIKDFSGKGTGVTAKDNMNGSVDKYRSYNSPEEFGADYVSMIKRKYPNAVGAKDASAFFSALKKGGYAEDPKYVESGVRASNMVGGVAPNYLRQPDAQFAKAVAPQVPIAAQEIAAVAAQPQAAPIPVPVLQEPQQVAVQAPVQEPDPWAAFQAQQRQAAPVQVADLGFGQPPPINVPDFMAALSKAPEQQVAWTAPNKTGSKYSALLRSLIG